MPGAPSHTGLVLRTLLIDELGQVLYFPAWWYTKGLGYAVRRAFGAVGRSARSFGVSVWLKNLFRPMYGQRDIAGRLISFFFRSVTIFFYSILLLAEVLAAFVFLIAWLALPLLVAYEFLIQLTGLFR